MSKKQFDIPLLIKKYHTGEISQEELRQLHSWIGESSKNKVLFDKIENPSNITGKIEQYRKYQSYSDKAWTNIDSSLKKQARLSFFKYAAAVLMPIAIGYFSYQTLMKDPPPVEMAQRIIPGEAKATLTLADGRIVNLEDHDHVSISEMYGQFIEKDSATIAYQKTDQPKSKQEIIYNQIDIPRGGEYTLILSDGSKVHINAMSSLRYPVTFSGTKREVELTGEAYFEVAHNAKAPFIVKTEGQEIEVLGTSFNISAYPEDQHIKTTLVEGSVKVFEPGKRESAQYLKPSFQSCYNRNTKESKIKEVDVNLYTAWKDGYFVFKDKELAHIMQQLERWYNIDVFYHNASVKSKKFGCKLNKYETIEPILEAFEETEKLRYELKGSSISFFERYEPK